MRRVISSLLLACLLAHTIPTPAAGQGLPADRVRLRLDTAEASAVLTILDAGRAGRVPAEADWRRIFSSEGYRRLKEREVAMRRAFTDSSFTAFVLSDSLGDHGPELRHALAAWAATDLAGAAARAMSYLPGDAGITATVYVVIKPATNSFVWDLQTNPAIFLYLDPALSPAQFENTVAHELHHIGFAGVRARLDSTLAALPDSVRTAAGWMGAFGEGFAMLAAAGGPEIHPHISSAAAERTRWDTDVARFNQDLRTLERFFQDVISRRLTSPDSVRAAASRFYGIQGPWYTVGWKMAVVIEKAFGRSELIRCMSNPGRLLKRYNDAAAEHNRTRPDRLGLWSAELLAAIAPNAKD